MSWFKKSVDERTVEECKRIIEGVKAVLTDSNDRIKGLKNDRVRLRRFAKEQLRTTQILLQNLDEMKQCRGLGKEHGDVWSQPFQKRVPGILRDHAIREKVKKADAVKEIVATMRVDQ